ncbi:hypothetical protein EIM50_25285 [Pseudoxanthomonas sp. SGD-10]|nr:hypothetical protein EIM50_25285 [Pseudoxanthomonas sp. SGD-10]
MNYKNYLLGFLALAFISFSSCDKVKDAIQADVDITPNSVTFEIPAITTTEEQVIAGAENISALDLAKYKGLKSVVVKSIKVELLEQNPSANFKALEKISVELASGSTTKVLATKTNNDFETNQYSLELPINGTFDIKDLVKNSFSYKITGKAKHTTMQSVPAKLTVVYTVKFGL